MLTVSRVGVVNGSECEFAKCEMWPAYVLCALSVWLWFTETILLCVEFNLRAAWRLQFNMPVAWRQRRRRRQRQRERYHAARHCIQFAARKTVANAQNARTQRTTYNIYETVTVWLRCSPGSNQKNTSKRFAFRRCQRLSPGMTAWVECCARNVLSANLIYCTLWHPFGAHVRMSCA